MDIGRSEPLNGGLQGPEPFHRDYGGDLTRRTAGLVGHIHRYQPARLGHGGKDGLFIQGHQGARIQHLGGNAIRS